MVYLPVVDPYPPIDECTYNNGECTQVCVDTYDSYYCTCRSGYRLAYNNYTCPRTVIFMFPITSAMFENVYSHLAHPVNGYRIINV